MTVEHGPLFDDTHEENFSWWLSGKMISSLVALFHFAGASIRYDTRANRLSLYGESENAGSPKKAGFLTGFIGTFSLFTYFVVMASVAVTGHIVADYSVLLALPFTLSVICICLLLGISVEGHGKRMKQMTVVDHTTEPLPDDLDDLKQQFVDGDLDDEEFEAQLEDRLTEVDG